MLTGLFISLCTLTPVITSPTAEQLPELERSYIISQLMKKPLGRDSWSLPSTTAIQNSMHSRNKRSVCSMPPFAELKRQWIEYQVSEPLHPSYYILPQYKQYIEQQLDKSTSPNEFIQYGDHQCPKSISQLSTEQNIQDQSLCPWYNVMNYDPDRYPSYLIEARCKCKTCTGIDPGSGAGCQPVYYNIPVLRRSTSCLANGQYKYDKGWQRITVGCTCAMASSR